MNNKILQSLIDSGHLTRLDENCLLTKNTHILQIYEHEFAESITSDALVVIQQALFDECVKKGFTLWITLRGELRIGRSTYEFHDEIIFKSSDTTRESWVEAYKKVMGIE